MDFRIFVILPSFWEWVLRNNLNLKGTILSEKFKNHSSITYIGLNNPFYTIFVTSASHSILCTLHSSHCRLLGILPTCQCPPALILRQLYLHCFLLLTLCFSNDELFATLWNVLSRSSAPSHSIFSLERPHSLSGEFIHICQDPT